VRAAAAAAAAPAAAAAADSGLRPVLQAVKLHIQKPVSGVVRGSTCVLYSTQSACV
jgi:hypothetical protein